MTRAKLLRRALRRAVAVAALVTLASSLTVVWMETADGADERPVAPQAIAFPALAAAVREAASLPRAGPARDAGAKVLPDAGAAVPVAAPVAGAAGAGQRAAHPVANEHLLIGKLNLNTASASELDLLPGIGPAKAGRVVAWRKVHGRFRRIRDLRRVKGFGRKTLEKLAPYLRLTGPTTLQAPSH